ncbi:MAG: elongation factor P [Candidatus Fraserbacteria bacterium RBG_16_55_9]|uniref:Elongation factor P n=1 Tax=Fraserbacteria sp. (strain RBG_16_55_9) TaxID=1817864 RepID=A0A1F5URS4_FRAXR|nr:MAG: elongation factor P [Candidatus Fraserbacteria bacterium RBG_16_55_9]
MGVSDLGRGMTIEWNGELYLIEEYAHMKKAQRRPVAQTKLRSLKTDRIFFQNFTDVDPFKIVRLEERPLQYLYSSSEVYYFMETQTYDQFSLTADQLGDLRHYLKENIELLGLFYEDRFVKVEPPLSVKLRVVRTDPGVRGDTVSGAEKPATLETGLEIKVPLFIKEGDVVKVDTRSGHYIERMSN